MRIYPFWNEIVETDCLGKHVCTGLSTGFSDLLDVLGLLTMGGPFKLVQDSELNSTEKQPSLFENPDNNQWNFAFCPEEMRLQKEKVIRLLKKSGSYSATWVFLEKLAGDWPPEFKVLEVLVPTKTQWEAVIAKYVPNFQGQIIVPKLLEQAAHYLKSLALAGEYSGDYADQLEGNGWEKLQFLWQRNLSISSLPISDLIHISYCLETVHEKAAFPHKSGLYIPKFFQAKLTSPTMLRLLSKNYLTPFVNMLKAIQNLNSEEGSCALNEWIYKVKGLTLETS